MRRALLLCSSLFLLTACPAVEDSANLGSQSGLGTDKKNVVLILLDDPIIDAMQLFSRIHLHGRKIDGSPDAHATDPGESHFFASLPVMDQMARSGVYFTEFNAQPGCSQTRACVLTGMYPFRRHGQGNIESAKNIWGDLFEFNSQPGFAYPLITDILGANEISSAFVGKWHLSRPEGTTSIPPGEFDSTGWSHIPDVGHFDQYVATFSNPATGPAPPKEGSNASAGTYYHYYLYSGATLEAITNSVNESVDEPENRDRLDRAGYLTRTQGIDAVRLINSHGTDEQFLLYLAPNSIHVPVHAPPVDMVNSPVFQTPGWPGKKFKNAQAMMESLDWLVGYVRNNMDPDILERTVFIIAGDNGTPNGTFRNFDAGLAPIHGSSGFLSESYMYLLGMMDSDLPPGASPALGPQKNRTRMKMTAFERGTRAPLIVWAGEEEFIEDPGRESLAMVDVVDILPTILDIMDVDHDAAAFDGVSFLPVLQGTVTRRTHERQFSFAEIYTPTGTGPTVNPRNSPAYLGEWSVDLSPVPAGGIVSYHNDTVRYYEALRKTFSSPSQQAGKWRFLATMQRGFRMDVTGTAHPGTYKILRNYFEDKSEYVDHFFALYDADFNSLDPIEAYDLQSDPQYEVEYHLVRQAFDRFLSATPPSLPIY